MENFLEETEDKRTNESTLAVRSILNHKEQKNKQGNLKINFNHFSPKKTESEKKQKLFCGAKGK